MQSYHSDSRTARRAVVVATLAVAALCGAVLAVAGPGGYVVQFAGCWAVALAGVVLWHHGRDTGGVR